MASGSAEAELVAEVTKAQIKFEMLQDQLKLLQGQVANARTHLEELTRKLDRARSHKARDPGLTALNERFVELGDDSMDTIAEERRQSATSTAARTSASADESKRKRPMGEPETAKEKEKRQRLEHLQSMLPAEVDMGAKSRPAARPPAPQMPREQNGVTVFNSGRPSGPAHGSSAPTAVPEPKRKVVMQTSNPRPASATPAPDDPNVETDKFSGLRLVKRLVSAEEMAHHMKERKLIHLKDITRSLELGGDIHTDWVTMGVIADKTMPRTASNDKKYCVVKLNDLAGTQVNLFLFDEAFDAHYKETVGSVIAVLNPGIARPQDVSDPIGINIDNPDKFLKIGTSCDLAICKSTRKDGRPCTMAIDGRESSYCVYHAEANFRNSKNKRQEFAMGTGEVTMGPPKKQLEMLAMRQQGGTVRSKPRAFSGETEAAPTYNFGGGRMITLGNAGKAPVEKRIVPSEEQNQRINEVLTKTLLADRSAGSKHLRLARGMAGLDDLKQEAAAGAAAPSGAFSEQLIRKIGYDPRHTMDDQGRRMVKKKVPQDQRSQDSSDSGGMGAGRSPIKAVADLAPKPVLPRSPIKAIADLAQTPVLARGESPKKQIILSDFDD